MIRENRHTMKFFPVSNYPFQLASQPNLKQSVFVFGGRTNSGNLGSTFVFGAGAPEQKFYDNYILGAAYQRDFFQFNSGILVGAEVGFADRFGHYTICCDSIVYSDSVVHSAELWGGISFRHQGIALFDAVQISPGFVFGLSAISNPIGQEAEHQIVHQGSAGVLFYLGFDLAFCFDSLSRHRTGFSHPASLRCLWNAGCHERREQRERRRHTTSFLRIFGSHDAAIPWESETKQQLHWVQRAAVRSWLIISATRLKQVLRAGSRLA